jgi:hypothetical protein
VQYLAANQVRSSSYNPGGNTITIENKTEHDIYVALRLSNTANGNSSVVSGDATVNGTTMFVSSGQSNTAVISSNKASLPSSTSAYSGAWGNLSTGIDQSYEFRLVWIKQIDWYSGIPESSWEYFL